MPKPNPNSKALAALLLATLVFGAEARPTANPGQGNPPPLDVLPWNTPTPPSPPGPQTGNGPNPPGLALGLQKQGNDPPPTGPGLGQEEDFEPPITFAVTAIPASVPEPTSLALTVLGLAGLRGWRRRAGRAR